VPQSPVLRQWLLPALLRRLIYQADTLFAFQPCIIPSSLSAAGTGVGSGEVASAAAGDRAPFQWIPFRCSSQLSPSGI